MVLLEGSYQNINDKGQARLHAALEKTTKYVTLRVGGGVGAEGGVAPGGVGGGAIAAPAAAR